MGYKKCQKSVIGIVGGLGPYAHIEFERRLLEVAGELLNITKEQLFPEWILSSIPGTPDRTEALCGLGEDPMPWLLQSLKRLESHYDKNGIEIPGADFAVIACNTSHKFLPEIRKRVNIPILDMVEETAKVVAERYPKSRVGLLATTGTLKSGIYHESLQNKGLIPLSPLDLHDGETLQRDLVMASVYGEWDGNEFSGNGIKNRGVTGEDIKSLKCVAALLSDTLNIDIFIAACTEISLVMEEKSLCGKPLIDPLYVISEKAIKLSFDL